MAIARGSSELANGEVPYWRREREAWEAEFYAEPEDFSPERDEEARQFVHGHGVIEIERSFETRTAPAGVSLSESMGAALEHSARKLDHRITAAARQRNRALRPRTWSPRRRGSCGRPRARARRTQRSARAGPSDSSGDGPGESSEGELPAGRHALRHLSLCGRSLP